jgi:hypothetical protein
MLPLAAEEERIIGLKREFVAGPGAHGVDFGSALPPKDFDSRRQIVAA